MGWSASKIYGTMKRLRKEGKDEKKRDKNRRVTGHM